jgi:hypothetical protein
LILLWRRHVFKSLRSSRQIQVACLVSEFKSSID